MYTNTHTNSNHVPGPDLTAFFSQSSPVNRFVSLVNSQNNTMGRYLLHDMLEMQVERGNK